MEVLICSSWFWIGCVVYSFFFFFVFTFLPSHPTSDGPRSAKPATRHVTRAQVLRFNKHAREKILNPVKKPLTIALESIGPSNERAPLNSALLRIHFALCCLIILLTRTRQPRYFFHFALAHLPVTHVPNGFPACHRLNRLRLQPPTWDNSTAGRSIEICPLVATTSR